MMGGFIAAGLALAAALLFTGYGAPWIKGRFPPPPRDRIAGDW